MLYSTITSFLGFKPNEGEYKVMGLAPYGDPSKYIKNLKKYYVILQINSIYIKSTLLGSIPKK